MYKNLLKLILDAAIPIAIISVFVFIVIMCIRCLFYMLIWIMGRFYKFNFKTEVKEEKSDEKKDVVVYQTEEDQQYRDLKKEKKKEMEEFKFEGVEKMNEIEDNLEFENEARIVDVAKPIGFWTSLVLGDQLTQILGRAQALNNKSHKGFWVSMLEAQAKGLGRQAGRSR